MTEDARAPERIAAIIRWLDEWLPKAHPHIDIHDEYLHERADVLRVLAEGAVEPTHWMPRPASPAMSIAESVTLLKDAIDRANTPDGPHPFLFDTLSLRDAKRILAAWALEK